MFYEENEEKNSELKFTAVGSQKPFTHKSVLSHCNFNCMKYSWGYLESEMEWLRYNGEILAKPESPAVYIYCLHSDRKPQ